MVSNSKKQPRRLATHILLKLECLVHLAREPVDEEATFTVLPARARLGLERGMHRVLEELDGHLHRYDIALADARSDKVTVLRVWAVLLGAQEITRGEVGEVEFLHKDATLCALT